MRQQRGVRHRTVFIGPAAEKGRSLQRQRDRRAVRVHAGQDGQAADVNHYYFYIGRRGTRSAAPQSMLLCAVGHQPVPERDECAERQLECEESAMTHWTTDSFRARSRKRVAGDLDSLGPEQIERAFQSLAEADLAPVEAARQGATRGYYPLASGSGPDTSSTDGCGAVNPWRISSATTWPWGSPTSCS